MGKKKTTSEIGSLFENQVATLLRLFGYQVTQNVIVFGSQVDIKATVDLPTHRDNLIVECKDYQESIGIEKVRDFLGLLSDAPGDTRGLFVSRNGFSHDAKKLAEDKPRITLTTYHELERKVFDATRYLERKVEAYQKTEIAGTYVEVSARDKRGKFFDSSEDALLECVGSEAVNFIALLGEYGSGKSTLMEHLEFRLAGSYLASAAGRMPILINLGDYTKALNLRQLITDVLVHRFGIRNPQYDIFEKFNCAGRLIMLFDGFDEMSSRVDDIIVRENLAEIQRLCVGSAKIVLACRNSFFRSREEELALLGIGRDILRESIEGSDTLDSSIFQLMPLTWPQIERVVERYERFQRKRERSRLDSEALLQRIRTTYNLEELAQRPFLLRMILRSVPHIGTSLRTLTAGVLYEIYTDSWIRRESEKGRTLETAERRMYFAEELAYEMHSRSHTMLHWRSIPEWIDRYLGIGDKARDYYDFEVRTCNFLSRNDQGYYFFAHRSFMEFFMARRLVKFCGENREYALLSEIDIGEETRQFMVDIGGNHLGANVSNYLQLVTLDTEHLRNASARLLTRNVLGLVKHLGAVRTIVGLLAYLRDGGDRNLKSYINHHLARLFDKDESPSTEVSMMLAGICLAIRGRKIGLTLEKMFRLWKAPARVKKTIERVWWYGELSEEGKGRLLTVEWLLRIEGGMAMASTAEIAFALCEEEAEIVALLKKLRAL